MLPARAVSAAAAVLALTVPPPRPSPRPRSTTARSPTSGMKTVGAASTSLKLPLQIGFVANKSGIQSAIKAASNPASSSYGKYPSLSTLQSKYGASSSKRKSVVNAFKSYGITAKVDVTHLRVSATVSVGKAQKMFGTKWKVYKTSTGSKRGDARQHAEAPEGHQGQRRHGRRACACSSSGGSSSAARAAVVADGGTPTRTGTPAFGCVPTDLPERAGLEQRPVPEPDPDRLRDRAAAGGRACRARARGVAIVGEAPTPASDVNTYRSCFGTQGTALKIHNAGSIKPILESSLDAMTVSMVAPKLDRFDLWVHPISESDDDGDVARLPGDARPAAAGDDQRHPAARTSSRSPTASASRPSRPTPRRARSPSASWRPRRRSASRPSSRPATPAPRRARAASPRTSSPPPTSRPQTSWPATLAVGAGRRRHEPDARTPTTRSPPRGAWNDTTYPAPFTQTAGGGGGAEHLRQAPVVAARAVVHELE